MRQNRQYILVLQDESTCYTLAMLIDNEKAGSIKFALMTLLLPHRHHESLQLSIRTDHGTGFVSLVKDQDLLDRGIVICPGDV